jgi:hypothetical protein
VPRRKKAVVVVVGSRARFVSDYEKYTVRMSEREGDMPVLISWMWLVYLGSLQSVVPVNYK